MTPSVDATDVASRSAMFRTTSPYGKNAALAT